MKAEKIVCPYCDEPYTGNVCVPVFTLKRERAAREEVLKIKEFLNTDLSLRELAKGNPDARPMLLLGGLELNILQPSKLRCLNCQKVFYFGNEPTEEGKQICDYTSDVEIITLKDM
uniref:Uncharacterized protein n=1 Tax=viral metagenome TaxID=1070528 RepID=A0A6M3IGA6_9ZZZZ